MSPRSSRPYFTIESLQVSLLLFFLFLFSYSCVDSWSWKEIGRLGQTPSPRHGAFHHSSPSRTAYRLFYFYFALTLQYVPDLGAGPFVLNFFLFLVAGIALILFEIAADFCVLAYAFSRPCVNAKTLPLLML